MKRRITILHGETFIETPIALWNLTLTRWIYKISNLCPMPMGHLMFKSSTKYYEEGSL